MLTEFSFILLPLCLLWFMSPNRLLQLMLIAAPFEAAAALVIGGLGFQPGIAPVITFLGFISLQILLGARFRRQAQVLRLALPFSLVAIWALCSSFLMPRLFAGSVMVWPQKNTPPFKMAVLEPTFSNINQDLYLLINCLLLLAAAVYLASSRVSLATFMRAYFISGFVVAGVAFWQLGNRLAGLPYPDSLFYSNPGWAILTTQSMGAMPRINGPSAEPSSLAGYMGSLVCATGWLLLKGHRGGVLRWLFVIGLTTMMISTSASGFAMLAFAGLGVSAYALLTGSTAMMARILKFGLPLIALVVVVAVVASIFVPAFNKNVAVIVDATLNKQDSSSYEERTGADLDSINVMLDTYFLGAGWGSNRSSSLIPGLMAAVGLPGCLCLMWFGVSIARRVSRVRTLGCSGDDLLVIDGCCGAITGFLICGAISSPTITSVTFFFLLALLIACLVRVEMASPKGLACRDSAPYLRSRPPQSVMSHAPDRLIEAEG